MSIWSKLIGIRKTEDRNNVIGNQGTPTPCSALRYAIIDIEVGRKGNTIHDIGALKYDGSIFHKASKAELFDFLNDIDYVCGHNIIHHDAKYLFADTPYRRTLVDTLYLSPLLFPEHPYHKLVKDDKLVSEQMNNPVNDCKKAQDLLLDEIARWHALPDEKRKLFASTASRTNLHYSILYAESDDNKYSKQRGLIAESDCPTIVYVSRTKRTKELADRLTRDVSLTCNTFFNPP